jgi:hypothetical protein
MCIGKSDEKIIGKSRIQRGKAKRICVLHERLIDFGSLHKVDFLVSSSKYICTKK